MYRKSLYILIQVFFSHIIIYVLAFLGFMFAGNVFSQQKATIVNSDTASCGSFSADLKIKLENVKAPIGFVYDIYDPVSGVRLKKDLIVANGDALFPDLDGIVKRLISESVSGRVVLKKFFDADIPRPWTINTVGYDGDKIVDGNWTFMVDEPVSPLIGHNDVPKCGYQDTLHAIPTFDKGTYYWKDVAGLIIKETVGFTGMDSVIIEANKPGTYEMIFVEENGACKEEASASVQLLGSPRPTITALSHICSSLDGDQAATIQMAVKDGAGNYSYKFKDTKGNLFPETGYYLYPDPQGVDSKSIKINREDTIFVAEMRDANNCPVSKGEDTTKTVVYDRNPFVNLGPDLVECSNVLDQLPGVISDSDFLKRFIPFYNWTSTSSNVSFGDKTKLNTSASVANNYGEYNLTLTATIDGCTSSDELSILFNEPPAMTLPKADSTFCAGESILMEVDANSDFEVQIDYAVNNTIFSIHSGNGLSTSVSPTETTTYQFTKITDIHGCETVYSDLYFTAHVLPVPKADAGSVENVCGKSINLQASPSVTVSENYQYSGIWSGKGVFEDANSYQTNFESAVFEDNSLVWTETVSSFDGYTVCSDEVSVDVFFEPDTITAFAGNDTIVFNQSNVVLSAREPAYGEPFWKAISDVLSFDPGNRHDATLNGLKEGDNKVNWIINFKYCESQSDEVIIKQRGLTNPNGFSPNGDGINDMFIIGGAEKVPNNKLVVFDGNGKLVYSQDNFSNEGWNGVATSGERLSNGTYYYVFTGDGIEAIKDFLIIKGEN